MEKGWKNPHTPEWNKKISKGVKRQHAEGRVRLVGFSKEARRRAVEKNWKGEKASLKAIHQWVYLWKGKPKKCEVCLTTKAKKFEWTNKDHKYKRILNDYVRMCTSCHRIYDIKNNNYKLKW